MSQLIEDALRAAGVRFFRGHHSDGYFFLVGAPNGRLHVHLDGGHAGTLTMTITPDHYYPARLRESLQAAAATATPALGEVDVHGSCDPALVGVVAQRCWSPADPASLRADVEAAVAAALIMFDRFRQLSGGSAPPDLLRDAG